MQWYFESLSAAVTPTSLLKVVIETLCATVIIHVNANIIVCVIVIAIINEILTFGFYSN